MGRKSDKYEVEKVPRLCGFCHRRERPTPHEFTDMDAVRASRMCDFEKVGCPRYHKGGIRQPMKTPACEIFAGRSKSSTFMYKLAQHVILGRDLPSRKRIVSRNERTPTPVTSLLATPDMED